MISNKKPSDVPDKAPEGKPVAGLAVLSDDASRKFSQLAPAPEDSPNAQQVGNFSVIPTEKNPTVETKVSEGKPVAGLSALSDDVSRKFSQLAPAPEDSPNAQQVGNISVIPTEKNPMVETKAPEGKPVAGLAVLSDDASRKFSQLAPAPTDSPNAQQVGNFSVIPTEKTLDVPAKAPEDKPVASLAVLSDDASRKFSQLAPAPEDSPHAKIVGNFAVIPTERKPSKVG